MRVDSWRISHTFAVIFAASKMATETMQWFIIYFVSRIRFPVSLLQIQRPPPPPQDIGHRYKLPEKKYSGKFPDDSAIN